MASNLTKRSKSSLAALRHPPWLEARSWSPAQLYIRRVLRHFFSGLQPHISLFPVRTVAGKLAPAPLLALEVRGAHRVDPHLEDLLHRFLHLGLGGLRGNLKHQSALRFLGAQAFFRDHRFADNLIRRLH